ncbi:acyltransferase [Granulosicoccaceae sp. 1_MG-2023]|nr:acyltransferase [Granulosicoccaceae sp. 1_MG-2023]
MGRKAGTMAFRPEIDGLRALAVLAVLFYHVDPQLVPGGFVGVDIFFVISGYLITRNILASLDAGTFSFRQFYIRRFRRLYPALLVTVSVSMVFAVLIFAPEHLARFAREVVAALFSVSNIFFWSESGYFDLDGAFKPLLHTWSLSVEEQFYLFWPALLLLISGLSGRYRFVCVAGLGLLSLLAAEYVNGIGMQSLAFYMLPFRIVEFVLGAGLVFLPRIVQSARSSLTMLALLAMLLPVFLYNGQTPFPGLSALLPCAGAALLIAAGSTAVSRVLLENPLALFLGKISYSVYLVHWPLVVFRQYLDPQPVDAASAVLLVFVSLLLGYLSWFLVEQPLRQGGAGLRRYRAGRVVPVLMMFSLSAALAAHFTEGRIVPREFGLTASEIKDGRSRRFDLYKKACHVLHSDDAGSCQRDAPEQVLVIGNSHEPDGYNLWHRAFASPSLNLITFGSTNHCDAFIVNPDSDMPDQHDCRQRLYALTDPAFVATLDTIIYSANKPYSSNKDGHYELLIRLKRMNPAIRVIILGGYFNLDKDCSYYMGIYGDPDACLKPEFVTYGREQDLREEGRWLASRFAAELKPLIIRKFDLACEESCLAAAGGEPFAYDQHHLSLQFASVLGQRLKERGVDALAVPDTGSRQAD